MPLRGANAPSCTGSTLSEPRPCNPKPWQPSFYLKMPTSITQSASAFFSRLLQGPASCVRAQRLTTLFVPFSTKLCYRLCVFAMYQSRPTPSHPLQLFLTTTSRWKPFRLIQIERNPRAMASETFPFAETIYPRSNSFPLLIRALHAFDVANSDTVTQTTRQTDHIAPVLSIALPL